MKIITSLQNDLIKFIIRLGKSSERRKQGMIVIEGFREIGLAVAAGIDILTILVCRKYFKNKYYDALLENSSAEVIEVTENVYAKIAYREDVDGMIAIAKPFYAMLENINLSVNPLIIILETIEKPGNLGGILRTADAAKADAVIICDSQTDIYNPNIIRSSLGSIFTNKVISSSNEETYNWLSKNKINILGTSLKAEKYYYECDLLLPTAVVMGSEASGLSGFWHQKADELIKIPMQGSVDSLNVSVSAAIVVFEAVRQRFVKVTY